MATHDEGQPGNTYKTTRLAVIESMLPTGMRSVLIFAVVDDNRVAYCDFEDCDNRAPWKPLPPIEDDFQVITQLSVIRSTIRGKQSVLIFAVLDNGHVASCDFDRRISKAPWRILPMVEFDLPL